MRRVRISLADGGVALAELRDDITNDEHLAKWSQSARPEWLPATIEDDNGTRPTDRKFRNAWRVAGQDVVVDMPAARDIHMDRIRAVRDDKLEETDSEFTRAIENSDAAEQARLRVRRQALRDLPQTFDLNQFQTPEDLDAAWPAELDGDRLPRRERSAQMGRR